MIPKAVGETKDTTVVISSPHRQRSDAGIAS